MKKLVAFSALLLGAIGCTTTQDGLTTSTTVAGVTYKSTPVVVGDLLVSPKSARKGETLKFSFEVSNPQRVDVRWSFDIQSKVEGTGTANSASQTVTHSESASDLISKYGYGSFSAHVRVYDGKYDTTYGSTTVSFELSR